MEEVFRHEYKFALGPKDEAPLSARLRAALPRDSHAGEDGTYRIFSVYFDNSEDKALREKLDGVNCREKFRVRYYNEDLSFIQVEKKSKRSGLCKKESGTITKEQFQKLLQGDLDWMLSHPSPVVRELQVKHKLQGLRPKSLVAYTREAFVYPAGNVRITLDSAIRSARVYSWEDLLSASCFPTGGKTVLMEVKYDRFLPEWIRNLISLEGRQAAAFSKYAVSRTFL
jgi:hypothetical protein